MTKEWLESASCASTDAEIFFPDKGGSNKLAKAVCGRCIVKEDCLHDVIDNQKTSDDQFGVIAGLSPRQRAKIRKQII